MKGTKPQVVEVRGKRYFVCDYTGAAIENRYYIPQSRVRKGCYATLPILLRHQYELLGPGPAFDALKAQVEEFYVQPNIPMQPALSMDDVPLGPMDFTLYAERLEMGAQWLLIEKSQPVDEYGERRTRNGKRAKLREEELEVEAEVVLALNSKPN